MHLYRSAPNISDIFMIIHAIHCTSYIWSYIIYKQFKIFNSQYSLTILEWMITQVFLTLRDCIIKVVRAFLKNYILKFTKVCFLMVCTTTRRLALSGAGSCCFLFIRNLISLWRHPNRLLMIQIPVECQFNELETEM